MLGCVDGTDEGLSARSPTAPEYKDATTAMLFEIQCLL